MRIRSGYSFKHAYGHLADVASRLKEIGWERQPISDRASTFGFTAWSKKVPAPIYGVELACSASVETAFSVDYWTFFAKSNLAELHDLVSRATWYTARDPTLPYDYVLKAKGVIKIMGEGVQLAELETIAKKHRVSFPQPDLYMALSPGMPRGLYREAVKRKLKFIACSDNLYPRAADKETYRIAMGRRANTQTYPLYILSDAEWEKAVSWASPADRKAALKNRNAVWRQCTAKLEKATLVVPERKETLRKMCERGAKRVGLNLKDPIYKARLDRELAMIAEKKFDDYFYIIADVISWSKDRMLLGPARGSSCGSLVCYLLDITTIDPIKFDLIFERFIDINRADLPDIDIDFSDEERAKAFEYVEKKYGRERTARLGTVGMFRPRSALNAAGAALSIPKWRVETVSDSLIVRLSGDSRALQTLEDTLRETTIGKELLDDFPEVIAACPLEGHPSNSSQHAAGVIITEKPINTYVAVDKRNYVAMCDKKDAEEMGMLKIDMLGLTQLSVFERTLELLGLAERSRSDGILRMKDGSRLTDWFSALPLDDKAAFEVLNQRHWSGIFQFNGHALQQIVEEIKTNHIEDIITTTALARPGPMSSGGTQRWIMRRTGREPITYPHPVFEPYMRGTLGVVAYQEQVMQIGREIGGLSWDDVTQLRKAMSKSLGKEYFDQYGDRWKPGAIKKGVPKEVADRVWDELCAYGAWAFNRAHAVAYGMVSYWACYLKAHHKAEFAAATLDAERDPGRQLLLLRELQNEGISYVPVDIHASTDRWNIRKDGTLVGPLTQIKGVGPKTVLEVMQHREHGTELKPSTAKKLSEKTTAIDSLYPVTEKVRSLHPDLSAINIFTAPTPIAEARPDGGRYVVLVIGVVMKVAPKNENEAVLIAKRGFKRPETEPLDSLNLWLRDDTDEVFCKIRRFDYVNLRGKHWAETLRAGKTIIAVKGIMQEDFRMISVQGIRWIGEMDDATDHLIRQGLHEEPKAITKEAAE